MAVAVLKSAAASTTGGKVLMTALPMWYFLNAPAAAMVPRPRPGRRGAGGPEKRASALGNFFPNTALFVLSFYKNGTLRRRLFRPSAGHGLDSHQDLRHGACL